MNTYTSTEIWQRITVKGENALVNTQHTGTGVSFSHLTRFHIHTMYNAAAAAAEWELEGNVKETQPVSKSDSLLAKQAREGERKQDVRTNVK